MHNDGWTTTTTKWHSNNNTWTEKMNWDICSDVLPNTGIWWPRPVQHYPFRSSSYAVRCTPPLVLVSGGQDEYYVIHLGDAHMQWDAQSTTTPGEFDMWKNADISRLDVPPANPT